MLWFYIAALIIIFVLFLWSKCHKQPIPVVQHTISKPFLAIAVYLVNVLTLVEKRNKNTLFLRKKNIRDRKILSQLRTLYPGEMSETHLYRLRVERISTVILILFTGCLIAAMISFMAMETAALKDGKLILREAVGGLDVDVDLIAGFNNNDIKNETNIVVTVPARIYSYDEASVLFENMDREIDEQLLGNNVSFDEVRDNLSLPRMIEGYPFSINWECDNYEYIDTDGTIHNEKLQETVFAKIWADCVYEHDHWYLTRNLIICPREYTEEEKIYMELDEAINIANEDSASEKEFILPKKISLGEIEWKEAVVDNSVIVLALSLIACLCLSPAGYMELDSAVRRRRSQLLNEYPAFVSKVTLYLGAGLSMRNSFLKLGHEGINHIKSGQNANYLEMEISILAHELEVGISETEVYAELGKRCGSREYMRFSTLLIQNLKKGSTNLVKLLEQEANDAFELRKNEARKLGEEASTKLLVPMIMMLSVVMIIIMVPAYLSFSG